MCPPTQQPWERALTECRSAGRTSPSRSRCPAEGWECWERSCGYPDRCLWCRCSRRPERCGSLKSSPPLPRPLPLIGSPADPKGVNEQFQTRRLHFEPHSGIVGPNQAHNTGRVRHERHLWRRFEVSPLTCVFALLGVTFSGSSGS